jgi:hypothetical protein
MIATGIKSPKTVNYRLPTQNWHALCEVLFEITDPGVSHAQVTVERPHS